jgi:DNA-binding NtrC family response regulator
MPRMDGLTMLSHVKRSYPHVLVIMVTAYSDMAKVRRSMNLGAYDYLIKPIEPSDMKKTVDRALKLVHRRS